MNSLVEELKTKLRITWYGEEQDLEKILVGAEAYLSDLTGASFDFEKEHEPRNLLLEYSRYDYNNATDEFEENYKKRLSRLIMNVALGRVGTVIEELQEDV